MHHTRGSRCTWPQSLHLRGIRRILPPFFVLFVVTWSRENGHWPGMLFICMEKLVFQVENQMGTGLFFHWQYVGKLGIPSELFLFARFYLPWVPEHIFFLSILLVRGEAGLTREKITSGHRSTQPHFHERNQFRALIGYSHVKLFDVANQGHYYIVNSLRIWAYPIGDPVQILNWFLTRKWGCVLLWPEIIFFEPSVWIRKNILWNPG